MKEASVQNTMHSALQGVQRPAVGSILRSRCLRIGFGGKTEVKFQSLHRPLQSSQRDLRGNMAHHHSRNSLRLPDLPFAKHRKSLLFRIKETRLKVRQKHPAGPQTVRGKMHGIVVLWQFLHGAA